VPSVKVPTVLYFLEVFQGLDVVLVRFEPWKLIIFLKNLCFHICLFGWFVGCFL